MALNLGDALLHLQVLTVKGYMSKNNAALAKCVVIAVVSANMIGNWAMEKKKKIPQNTFSHRDNKFSFSCGRKAVA